MNVILDFIKSLGNVSGLGVEVSDVIKTVEQLLADEAALVAGAEVKQQVGVLALKQGSYKYGVYAQKV